jgi:hypothetical protein
MHAGKSQSPPGLGNTAEGTHGRFTEYPSYMDRDLRNALLCALLPVAATLATLPFLDMGVNDDWSYVRTTQELAATGKFRYNGWATAMVGFRPTGERC